MIQPVDKSKEESVLTEKLRQDIQRVSEIKGYYSFDQMYNTITQKVVKKVITDKENQGISNDDTRLSTYLLIGGDLKDGVEQKDNTPKKENLPNSKKFEELYKESEIKKQKLKRIQHLKEQQKKFQEEQECTFSPQILSSNIQSPKSPNGLLGQSKSTKALKPRRSPKQFYEDMMTFQEQKEIKLVTLRKLEEMQQLGAPDFDKPFRSPSKDLY